MKNIVLSFSLILALGHTASAAVSSRRAEAAAHYSRVGVTAEILSYGLFSIELLNHHFLTSAVTWDSDQPIIAKFVSEIATGLALPEGVVNEQVTQLKVYERDLESFERDRRTPIVARVERDEKDSRLRSVPLPEAIAKLQSTLKVIKDSPVPSEVQGRMALARELKLFAKDVMLFVGFEADRDFSEGILTRADPWSVRLLDQTLAVNGDSSLMENRLKQNRKFSYKNSILIWGKGPAIVDPWSGESEVILVSYFSLDEALRGLEVTLSDWVRGRETPELQNIVDLGDACLAVFREP